MDYVKQYLHTDISKPIFGVETDCLLSERKKKKKHTQWERDLSQFPKICSAN